MISLCAKEDLPGFIDLAFQKNSIPRYNCAYCANSYDAVKADFTRLAQGEAHLLAGNWEAGVLTGMMGFFVNESNGWVDCIGPFFRHAWDREAAKALFLFGRKRIKHAAQFNFSFNCENTDYGRFMAEINAERQDNEYILALKKEAYQPTAIPAFVTSYLPKYREALIALHQEVFGEIYLSGEEMIKAEGKNRKIFCALENEALVGYGVLSYNSEAQYFYAEVLGVREDQRGKGYGRALLNAIVRYAFWDLNGNHIKLVVDKLNEGAQKLYFSCGFSLHTEYNAFSIKCTI